MGPALASGRIAYYYSTKNSRLPIRDVDNSLRMDHVLEPNLESSTYNMFASCNQRIVAKAVEEGSSHLFFVTRYNGLIDRLQGHPLFTGFYLIDEIAEVEGRKAIRSRQPYFVDADRPLFVSEVWVGLFGKKQRPNLRWDVKGAALNSRETRGLVKMLHSRGNATRRYVSEINRLKKES